MLPGPRLELGCRRLPLLGPDGPVDEAHDLRFERLQGLEREGLRCAEDVSTLPLGQEPAKSNRERPGVRDATGSRWKTAACIDGAACTATRTESRLLNR